MLYSTKIAVRGILTVCVRTSPSECPKVTITNGGLSPYYIFVVVMLSVVGDHHIMPSLQDQYDTRQNSAQDEATVDGKTVCLFCLCQRQKFYTMQTFAVAASKSNYSEPTYMGFTYFCCRC